MNVGQAVASESRARHGDIRRAGLAGLVLLLGSIAGGCGSGSGNSAAQPLTAEQFRNPTGAVAPDGGTVAGAPVEDTSGSRDEVSVPGRPAPRPAAIRHAAAEAPRDVHISPAVQKTIKSDNAPTTAPGVTTVSLGHDAEPATRPTSTANGQQDERGPQVMDLGFIIMVVNAVPISSDKVLKVLERPLAAEAKKRNEADFRNVARQMLAQQVEFLKRNELEFAAAEKESDPADKQLAEQLTTQWRQQQITAAGGSLEMARRRAAADGWDFEELAKKEYRDKLLQIYYQKRILPRIAVRPRDMRAYYDSHKADFSTSARLKFLVIRIDPKEFGSVEDAFLAAEKIRDRVKTEPFAKVADEVNKDGRGGAVGTAGSNGWVESGSYRYDDVEKAVAELKPGQVTDVIKSENKLFIAKLEDIQNAKVQAFEDSRVQERITQRLQSAQMEVIRLQTMTKLEREAITHQNEGYLDGLTEIVMRRYPVWAKSGQSS